MIKQLLNRDFILKSAEALDIRLAQMIQDASDAKAATSQVMEDQQVDISELQAARNELRTAIEEEKKKTVPDQQNGNNYIPSNSILSLVQTSLQQYCEKKIPDEVLNKSEEIKALGESDEVPTTERELSPIFADLLSDDTPTGITHDFELLDIGWLNCVFAIGIRNWRKRFPFNPKPADPVKIGNHARVILFSDWGSGLPRAQKVTQEIRKQLDDPAAAARDKHLIHLGDVYYSGWAEEYEQNLLPYWSVKPEEANEISSWCLNGNHDMYSGGAGFFDYLLRDARFAKQQKSSFFSLENDRWQLLGLDTGYHEQRLFDPHDLYGNQNEWVYKKLKDAPEKKGILLSHHQPFSAFASGGEKILAKLRQPLDEKLIHTWFWGHEHRCTVYKERENIKFPRCIGHGGIPFYVETAPLPDMVSYEYRDGFDHNLETWNYFGFVVLDFDDDVISVRYINERGETHLTETIQ